MLMGSHDRRVDHRVFIVGIVRQGLEKILPNAARGPAGEALVRIAPVAKTFRQIAPWRSDTELPDYRFDKKAIAQFAVAADRPGTARQQIFDPGELVVAQCMAFHHSLRWEGSP
jgi:hypothetical protein